MDLGVKDSELNALRGWLAGNDKIERAVVYGSRAKGTHKKFSDIDIALWGPELTHRDVVRLLCSYEELLLPYQMDLLIFNRLKNKELVGHIERVGQVIYTKK